MNHECLKLALLFILKFFTLFIIGLVIHPTLVQLVRLCCKSGVSFLSSTICHSSLCQFHQCFLRAFFVRLIRNVTRKKDVCTKNACKKNWWNWPLVSILSIIYVQIFCMNIFSAAFSTYVLLEKSCRNTVGTKNLRVNCWWNWLYFYFFLLHWRKKSGACTISEILF